MALRTHDMVKDISLIKSDGKKVKLSTLLKGKKHLLIVFFRGSWCSFCNMQLADLARNYKKFKKLKTEILGISVDTKETIREFTKKHDCPFPLVTDANRRLMNLFGVKDPLPITGALLHAKTNYPKPAIFLLDPKRKVVFTYIGKTFYDRPKARNLLKVIQS